MTCSDHSLHLLCLRGGELKHSWAGPLAGAAVCGLPHFLTGEVINQVKQTQWCAWPSWPLPDVSRSSQQRVLQTASHLLLWQQGSGPLAAL